MASISWPGPAVGRLPRHGLPSVAAVLIGASIVLAHRAYQASPWAQPTPLALANELFALAVTGALVMLSWALGRRLVRAIGLPLTRFAEEAVFSLGLGLAICSYSTFVLALLHMLYPIVVACLAILAAVLVRS